MAVKIDGAEQIIARLKGFEKETYAILQKEVREASSSISNDAKSAVPGLALRKWGPWNVDSGSSGGFRNTSRDLAFRGSAVQASIKPQFRTRKGRIGSLQVYGRVAMGDAAGAIFSLAGKRNPDAFGGHIARKYGNSGPWPRLLGPAWHANIDVARREIEAAVNRAAEKVTRG